MSGLAAPLGRQKCFSSLDKETHHIYSLHIPVCGAPPTYPCSPFPDGQVAQMGFQATVPSFNLGTYAETWFLASIDGAPALATLFLGGDVCMNIGARNSTLFIVCDRAMVFDSLVARESNCSYSFQLFTSDPQICDSLLPCKLLYSHCLCVWHLMCLQWHRQSHRQSQPRPPPHPDHREVVIFHQTIAVHATGTSVYCQSSLVFDA